MHQNFPYGQFGVDHLRLSGPGIELFNKEFYWECHEALEDPWIEDRSDNARYVYWAIIQVAATMVHVRDEKYSSAALMLKKAKNKFEKCKQLGVVTSLVLEFLNWDELENIVFSIPENPSKDDFTGLSKFKFDRYPFHYFKD
jgi:hypothetical protein